MMGTLRSGPEFTFRKFTVEIRPLERLPTESVVLINESFEVVNKFMRDDYCHWVALKKVLWLELDVSGRNVEIFCLYSNSKVFSHKR